MNERSSVVFKGTLSKADFVQATKLSILPTKVSRVFASVLVAIVVFGVVVAPALTSGSIKSAILGAAVLLAVLGIVIYSFRFALGRAFESNKLLRAEVSGLVTAEAVEIRSSHSQATIPWDILYQVRVSPTLILLYQSTVVFYPFPRDFFDTEESWQQFESWALAFVPTKSPSRRDRTLKTIVLWAAVFTLVLLLRAFFN